MSDIIKHEKIKKSRLEDEMSSSFITDVIPEKTGCPTTVTIEVRFADGQVRKGDVDVKKDQISDLKNIIFKNELVEGIECQLIYLGKFLNDQVKISELNSIEEGLCMHGRIKQKPPPEDNEPKKKDQEGFNKLVNSGFSLEEIELMRLQFHRNRQYNSDYERVQREQE